MDAGGFLAGRPGPQDPGGAQTLEPSGEGHAALACLLHTPCPGRLTSVRDSRVRGQGPGCLQRMAIDRRAQSAPMGSPGRQTCQMHTAPLGAARAGKIPSP